MKFTRSEDRRFEIERVRLPLVALIDVVLFLLLYFMIAGSLAGAEAEQATSLRSDKPGKGQRLQPGQPDPVCRAGREGYGTFRLGDRVVNDKSALPALLRQLPKENGINVKGSPRVTVADVAGSAAGVHRSGLCRQDVCTGKVASSRQCWARHVGATVARRGRKKASRLRDRARADTSRIGG
jgi:biopolymer transport protein ExbD